MKVFFNGCQLDRLPPCTSEEKLQKATRRMTQIWNTPTRSYCRKVYNSCRDEQKKAGKREEARNPADNGNHDDGKPAA